MPMTPWTPANIGPRLQAWYDASNARTIQTRIAATTEFQNMAAMRGALLTVGATNTTWNTTRINRLATVSIDQVAGQHLDAPVAANAYNVGSNGFAMFCVFRASSVSAGGPSNGSGTYVWDRNASAPDYNLCSLKVLNGGGSVAATWGVQIRSSDQGGLDGARFLPVTVGRSELVCVRWTAVDGLQVYSRGVRMPLTFENGTTAYSVTTLLPDAIRLGYLTYSGGASLFHVGEWLCVNDGYSNSLRQRIEAYLGAKWGIPVAGSYPQQPMARRQYFFIGQPTTRTLRPVADLASSGWVASDSGTIYHAMNAVDGVRATTSTAGAMTTLGLG